MIEVKYVTKEDKNFGIVLISIYLKMNLIKRFGINRDMYCLMMGLLLVY